MKGKEKEQMAGRTGMPGMLVLLLLLFVIFLASCKRETPVGETPAEPGEQKEIPPDDVEQEEKGEVTLYLPNEAADGFITSSMILTDTPQGILDELAAQGALPEGVSVLSFDADSAVLDLSQEFEDTLTASGTTGEWLYLGSVVNTFLDHYKLKELTVLCEGEVIETGHNRYDTAFTYFEY